MGFGKIHLDEDESQGLADKGPEASYHKTEKKSRK
jgi:hypothetical protein